jgi:hypothetical protein
VIVLDTNVVSELMRPAPSPAVVSWVSRRDASTLFFSAVGEAELRFGVATMPAGRRRNEIEEAVEAMLREDFAGRVLPFDSAAARAYAGVVAARRAAGRPVATMDMQIAAIAQSRNMAVATRNTKGFTDTGVDLADPWTDD